MADIFSGEKIGNEGYVYNAFGSIKYLKHAVTSCATLRRYDQTRGVVLFCTDEHFMMLKKSGLENYFTRIYILPGEHRSITGFKHHVYKFMPFKRSLFLDSDIVWCKNPDSLWKSFSAFGFTITGNPIADIFFGGPKGLAILRDVFLRRRTRTLKRFGLTYLSRVQSGIIYASDEKEVKKVSDLAGKMLERKKLTHFRSRKEEKGRSEESCEWSLAMAMSELKKPVYPWLNGNESPQLDFIEDYTEYDEGFKNVKCLLYNDRFTYDLKALQPTWARNLIIKLLSIIPGKTDHQYVTPYCLHFGWYNQKEPYYRFSNQIWTELTKNRREQNQGKD